jgi:type II secretory pathway component PulK
MRVETKLAMNSNNETEMEWTARSGVELARYVLGQEMIIPGPGTRFDALNQKWAGGSGETNDTLASITMTDVPLGNGKFSVKITDADRKLNINNFANNEAVMTEALTVIGTDASEIPTIISSIQDWIDVDNETHVNGAESDYYGTLSPPYWAKNGPIDDLSELLLVKGVTPEIYWGPNSTNHQLSIFQAHPIDMRSGLLPTTPMNSMGLADIFTPISSGKLNINTCTANSLRAIGMDEGSASRLISLRAGPDGVDGTEDDVPFNNVGEIINAGLPPALVQQFTSYLTVRSFVFEVEVNVEVGLSKRTYHALLFRASPKDIQILGMHWE